MNRPPDGVPDGVPGVTGPLSDAERRVLDAAALVEARRERSAGRDEFARLALLPSLWFEPGSADEVTSADRQAVRTRGPGAGSASLAEILGRRRSVAGALGAVARADLVVCLARSYRVVEASQDDDGRAWSRRPVPSGGATHPFDLLVSAVAVTGLPAGHYVFGSNAVSLRRLAQHHAGYAEGIDEAVRVASRRTGAAPATVSLVANVERVAQHYSSVLAHLFRDAGVLLQTLHLIATDLGLHSSIIGSAGQRPAGAASVGAGPTTVHCGALVLGSAAESDEQGRQPERVLDD